MRNRLLVFCALLALIVGTAAAQDARSVLQAAATTMGVTNLKSINIPDRLERCGGPELQPGAGLAAN